MTTLCPNCDPDDDWDEDESFVSNLFDALCIPALTILTATAALALSAVCILIIIWASTTAAHLCGY